MGVDFYPCKDCGETFPDCGSYVFCEGCSSRFCHNDCADMRYLDDNQDEQNCKYCRMETATSSDLLYALLKHFSLTHDDALEILRKQNQDG